MNRTDAVIQLDVALDHLDKVLEMLNRMGATYSTRDRLRVKINQLTDRLAIAVARRSNFPLPLFSPYFLY